MENNQNLLTAELQVDSIAHSYLKETARWANFLAILGFIICAFIVLVALFAGAFLSNLGGAGLGSAQSVLGTGLISGIYIIIAVIYFILSLLLFRFASKMKTALQVNDQENFNLALHNLKLVYRITGIIVIVYLAVILLALIFGIGAAFLS